MGCVLCHRLIHRHWTTMYGCKFSKLYVAVVGQAGFVILLMVYAVHYRSISSPFAIDQLSSDAFHPPCVSRLSGRTTSLQQLSNSRNLSMDQRVVAGTDPTAVKFLSDYETYCQVNLRPKASNVIVPPSEVSDCLCPCIPSGLGTFLDSLKRSLFFVAWCEWLKHADAES